MGMIESKQGSGHYLTGSISNSLSGMIRMMLLLNWTSQKEICAVRRSLEKCICKFAADQPVFPAWQLESERLLNQEAADIEEEIENDRKFHYLLVVGGIVISFLGSLVSNAITGQIPLNLSGIQELLVSAAASLVFALVYGSVAIPLIFRFGAEQGRVLLVAALLVPAAVCFAAYQVGKWLGIVLTDQVAVLLVCGVAVAALVWMAVSYRISCGIFAKQEL